jgi:2-keto-4-pentenoate hydratase/2-oxohepta-3-ene-1,7-dioic acid hydratase in catechol pathway
MTIEAGDIITTGTPSGVGLGLNPQIWLKDGDVVEAGIEGIGSIRNTVRAV